MTICETNEIELESYLAMISSKTEIREDNTTFRGVETVVLPARCWNWCYYIGRKAGWLLISMKWLQWRRASDTLRLGPGGRNYDTRFQHSVQLYWNFQIIQNNLNFPITKIVAIYVLTPW